MKIRYDRAPEPPSPPPQPPSKHPPTAPPTHQQAQLQERDPAVSGPPPVATTLFDTATAAPGTRKTTMLANGAAAWVFLCPALHTHI